jgi:hypothetical protein
VRDDLRGGLRRPWEDAAAVVAAAAVAGVLVVFFVRESEVLFES